MFLVINEETGHIDPCGSLPAIQQTIGLTDKEVSALEYKFSVKKLLFAKIGKYEIQRKELIKSNARRLKNEVSV